MKKRIALLLLAVITATGFAGCGAKTETNKTEVAITDSLELIETVWGSYSEDDLFPVCGGDSANLNFEGPAAFDATNTEELDVTLGFPADKADMIDDAASMMNAMMANNFTIGVFRVTDSANVDSVAEALKENITARQWMCGMPEKMLIAKVGNYVVAGFGLEMALDTFEANLTAAYDVTEVIYEENIM